MMWRSSGNAVIGWRARFLPMQSAVLSVALAIFAIVVSDRATAADANSSLRIGVAVEVNTLDPHFQNIGPNVNIAMHLFDGLINVDRERGKLKPGLAESWRAIDDLTWEFKLRRGVKFHDGSEFSAEDVIYSFDRPATLTNSTSPFTTFTRSITEKIIVDKYTVRFKTAKPHALVPEDVSNIFIVAKKHAGMTTEDYNAGRAAIGTGPYKIVSFARGDRIELARNDQYWGAKPAWEKVTLRMMTTPSARVAALLAGDVDAIDDVPPADYSKLKTNPALSLHSTASNRVVFLELDQQRDSALYITDKDGKPLAKNPLKDLRVRRALALAIQRDAITSRVLEGNGAPAMQFVPEGVIGFSAALPLEKADPVQAKKLLAEAGYPAGFNLVLHGPSGRYVNDEKILQTIAQMFSRIGVTTRVETAPVAVYFGRLTKLDATVMMYGWGGGTGHPANYFKSLLTTHNPEKGTGMNNYGRYSNARLDTLTEQGYAAIDPTKADALWREAAELVFGPAQQALIPLHFQMNVWATKKGIKYYPRADERTLAWEFTPTP